MRRVEDQHPGGQIELGRVGVNGREQQVANHAVADPLDVDVVRDPDEAFILERARITAMALDPLEVHQGVSGTPPGPLFIEAKPGAKLERFGKPAVELDIVGEQVFARFIAIRQALLVVKQGAQHLVSMPKNAQSPLRGALLIGGAPADELVGEPDVWVLLLVELEGVPDLILGRMLVQISSRLVDELIALEPIRQCLE